MITATECRGHGVECRRMATRAQSLRMKALLVDMARGWDRLAVEAEQNTQTNEPALRLIKPTPSSPEA